MRKLINRAAAGFLAAMILSGIVFAAFELHAGAAKSEYDNDDFTIDAKLSLSASAESFDITVEVTNDGPDFEGMVRVIPDNGGRKTCAYDTVISLSKGSTKQFVVSVPISSLDIYYNRYGQTGALIVVLLDQDGNKVTTENYSRFFQGYQEKVIVGILSDKYDELDYFSLYGGSVFVINNNYPIELMELSKNTLTDELEKLDYLIIDQYDTSQLSEDAIAAIEEWTDQGGMLIFGTGAYAYDVFAGFDPQFLQTECLGIYMAGTSDFVTEQGRGRDMYSETGSYSPYDYYGVSIDMYLNNIYETDTAILDGLSQYDGYYHYGQGYGNSLSSGSGSITYLYYALSDPDVVNASPAYVAENIFSMAADQTNLNNSAFHNTDESGIRYVYNIRSALGIIDMERANINYGMLNILIAIYVILIGPVVYLVLRYYKKRELYWAAVPALALLFVGIISFAGKGFRIADTTVCSVTFVNTGNDGETGSVLYAYSADHDDWLISLADECAYAGPLQKDYGWSNDPMEYYFRVVEDLSGTSVGIRPGTSFETTMFQCRAADPVKGEILTEDIEVTSRSVRGHVTNETGHDFSCMLIYDNRYFAVVEGIEDGEEINLKNAEVLERGDSSSIDDIFWMTAERNYEDNKSLAAQMAALYVGLRQAVDYQGTVVLGVVPNYDRVTEGNYTETSYGVFYYIQ